MPLHTYSPPTRLLQDTSFGLELFVRVERTFCCGLQASDPETREKVGAAGVGGGLGSAALITAHFSSKNRLLKLLPVARSC